MGLADGVVVVKARACVYEDVIDPRTEKARDSESAEFGKLVGNEGEQTVDEKQHDHYPFEDGEDHEVWEAPKHLLMEALERFCRHVRIRTCVARRNHESKDEKDEDWKKMWSGIDHDLAEKWWPQIMICLSLSFLLSSGFSF